MKRYVGDVLFPEFSSAADETILQHKQELLKSEQLDHEKHEMQMKKKAYIVICVEGIHSERLCA